jgi:UDP-N-acetylglucosamine 2-epimerase (non-hydrolysing)
MFALGRLKAPSYFHRTFACSKLFIQIIAMKLTIIAGARPNFMKIAPIIEAIESAKLKGYNIHYRLVHTGQHYDDKMSKSFFEDLNIPKPHINLECGGGTQAEQTANIMVRFEQELLQNPADLVLVVGDVTSTLACSIVAKKLCTDVAHVEAGIRSGDWTMPEEINRIVTDSISDLFFTTSETANENLLKSGIDQSQIHFVGNTMIDTLMKNMPRLIQPAFWNSFQLQEKNYFVLTLHRPSNVDDAAYLSSLLKTIDKASRQLPILFPVHPRTAKKLEEIKLNAANLRLIEPMNYLEFIYIIKHCKAVITDSGGITEETTVLNIPCITLRTSTERPETVVVGTNELVGNNSSILPSFIDKIFDGNWKKGDIPELWDGMAASRIVDVLIGKYCIDK